MGGSPDLAGSNNTFTPSMGYLMRKIHRYHTGIRNMNGVIGTDALHEVYSLGTFLYLPITLGGYKFISFNGIVFML